MTRLRRSRLGSAVSALAAICAGLIAAKPLAAAETDPAGQALAAELRSARPPSGFTNEAVLRVRDADGKRSATPLTMASRLANDSTWEAVYSTPAPGQTLTIVHHLDAPAEYRWTSASGGARELTPAEIAAPFAGSDFWPRDLGLDFLQWPEQKLVRREKPEMRKGRACKLLESANPNGLGYVRVRSWIDVEHRQPIMAEAYDAAGRLVKTFSVGSVEKVDGEWRLKDLEMTDETKGSRTRLEFEYRLAGNPGP